LERIKSNLLETSIDIKDSVFFRSEKINFLSEVTKREPFLGKEKIVSLVDLDGVLCEYGFKNNQEDNVLRLLALKNIVSKSDEFVFWSSRFEVDENKDWWKILKPVFGNKSITKCPFITESSIGKLEHFAQKANPECLVKFKIGLRKMRSCFAVDDDILSLATKTLEQDKKLVMVGSSIFDRQIIKQVVKETVKKGIDSKNIYYFDTGHWLI
jgi:hypothetical protein